MKKAPAKIFVILGPSGCGKGTQAQLLADRFKIPALGMGKILRHAYAERTLFGMEAEKYWREGRWVPDELTFKILRPFLESKSSQNGFVLEGFPRTVNQAKLLDAFLERKGKSVGKVFHLETADETSMERIRAGRRNGTRELRRDDLDAALVERRLSSYHDHVRPLLAYYGSRGVLERVDNEPPPPAVQREILSRLKEGEKRDQG